MGIFESKKFQIIQVMKKEIFQLKFFIEIWLRGALFNIQNKF